MQEPAVTSNAKAASRIAGSDVGELRRWLWERFNLSATHQRPGPPRLAAAWQADPIACARSLQLFLGVLVREGACDSGDADAWSRVACLEGRRTRRTEVEASAGLSARGLGGRLQRVDDLLAHSLVERGIPRAPSGQNSDPVVFSLIESMAARDAGRDDEADGYYATAADLAGLPPQQRRGPLGRDRSARARTRMRGHAGAPLASAGTRGAVLKEVTRGPLLVTNASLHDDPDYALQEVDRAWRARDLAVLPLLLRTAVDLIPDRATAGALRRQHLLELGSNILRDAESLAALAWTSLWVSEVDNEDAASLRAVVNGRKTKAHILQLHGFVNVAAMELQLASQTFTQLQGGIEDFDLLQADLIVRRTATDVLLSQTDAGRTRVERLLDSAAPQRMRLSARRYQLHLESDAVARTKQRRTFGATRASRYAASLERLIEEVAVLPDEAQMSVLDTIVASAIRVGDVRTIRDVVDRVDWNQVHPQPNIAHRLNGRLRLAAKLPGLSDLGDIVLADHEHPLAPQGASPTRLEFLL